MKSKKISALFLLSTIFHLGNASERQNPIEKRGNLNRAQMSRLIKSKSDKKWLNVDQVTAEQMLTLMGAAFVTMSVQNASNRFALRKHLLDHTRLNVIKVFVEDKQCVDAKKRKHQKQLSMKVKHAYKPATQSRKYSRAKRS